MAPAWAVPASHRLAVCTWGPGDSLSSWAARATPVPTQSGRHEASQLTPSPAPGKAPLSRPFPAR